MENMQKRRIDWIDCAKGIGILLVIFGHSLTGSGSLIEYLLLAAIFSFHMPLFFILSATTFKFSDSIETFKTKTVKAFRHLVLPALVIYLIRSIISFVDEPMNISTFLKDRLFTLLFASGVSLNIGNLHIREFGMIWFFIVLFIGRSFYDFIHINAGKSELVIFCLIMSALGAIVGRYQFLPLSLDIVLAVMPLFFVGEMLKKQERDNNTLLWCLISGVLWLVSFGCVYYFGHGFLELAARKYPLYPLCLICAVFGTLFIGYICQLISEVKVLNDPLKYIGKNSIYLYCVHAMDYLLKPVWLITGNVFINGIVRVALDVLISMLILFVLGKVRKAKTNS